MEVHTIGGRMNKEIIEDEIDSCLITLSDGLYDFHDQVVSLLNNINYIEHLQRLRDKQTNENHLH